MVPAADGECAGDAWTFAVANWEFAKCAANISPVLAILVGMAVASPFGWWYYQVSKKERDSA